MSPDASEYDRQISTNQSPEPAELLNWRQTFATGIWFGLLMAAIVVHSMRQSGEIEQQISGFVAGFVALVANLISLTANQLFHSSSSSSKRWTQLIAGIATLVPPAMLGTILLPDETPLGALWLVSLFLTSAIVMLKIGRNADLRARKAAVSVGDAESEEQRKSERKTIDLEYEPPADVTQWLTRRTLQTGDDCVEGLVRVEFAADEKQTVVHLPFSPPFSHSPEVDCEFEGIDNCRARVTTVHPFGARIELRRSGECETPESGQLQFCATCATQRERAA